MTSGVGTAGEPLPGQLGVSGGPSPSVRCADALERVFDETHYREGRDGGGAAGERAMRCRACSARNISYMRRIFV